MSYFQEERCGDAEHEVGQVMRMQEEVELLQNALRDIAHAVIQDAESRDTEQPQTSPHLHLTPAGPVPQRYVSNLFDERKTWKDD